MSKSGEPRTEAGRRLLKELDLPGDMRWFSFRADILAIEAEARQQDTPALREADEAASVAHDYIWPQEKKSAVTREEASDAIWTIHNALRPLLAARLTADVGAADDADAR